MMRSFPILFLSPAPLQKHSESRTLVRHPRRPPQRLRAGPPPPPKVKPAYYKNPSKAIEKGGGFYIPGLRGPRLRVAVSALAGALLALNHLTGNTASAAQGSLYVSEALATAAVATVLATALADLSAQRVEAAIPAPSQSVPSGTAPRVNPVPLGETTPTARVAEVVAWAEAVCTDLTGSSVVTVCRAGRVVHTSGSGAAGMPAGEAVRRVSEEDRALYIDDSSALPPDVMFPFLKAGGPWAVFLVPVSGGKDVVAFCKKRERGGFAKGDRAWLAQMALRISGGTIDENL